MSNVSIFEKKWIDLVFEGKNKAYGAYQLRRQSPRTTLVAFFIGLFFIGSVSGVGLLLSSFGNPPATVIDDFDPERIIRVDRILPPDSGPEHIEPLPATNTSVVPPLVNNQNFVVAPTNEAQPDVPETNTGNPSNANPDGQPGAAPSTATPGTGGEGPETGPAIPAGEGPEIAAVLDEQPEFPGGIGKFYQYVGDHFDKPEIENVSSVSVHVSFVIEKDGSMTDIKVLRNPGYGLDKEAIRVLKSLRTKWKPGIKNGQKVRTQYVLPIKVVLN